MDDMRKILVGESCGRDSLIITEAVACALLYRTQQAAAHTRSTASISATPAGISQVVRASSGGGDSWILAVKYGEVLRPRRAQPRTRRSIRDGAALAASHQPTRPWRRPARGRRLHRAPIAIGVAGRLAASKWANPYEAVRRDRRSRPEGFRPNCRRLRRAGRAERQVSGMNVS